MHARSGGPSEPEKARGTAEASHHSGPEGFFGTAGDYRPVSSPLSSQGQVKSDGGGGGEEAADGDGDERQARFSLVEAVRCCQ